MRIFRLTALLEGISYILLLLIATPIKYLHGDPTYVKLLGMPHGVLFIVYVMLALRWSKKKNWGNRDLAIVLICSVIPFGTFWVDRRYLK
jgi:integral membrane protein